MARGKIDFQIVLISLCALAVVLSWLGTEWVRDRFGNRTERYQLSLRTDDLHGLRIRSELRCRGAVIGHVTQIISKDSTTPFNITAGVKSDFADWAFGKKALVRANVIENAVMPSSIDLQPSAANIGVKPHRSGELIPASKEGGTGGNNEILLEPEETTDDFKSIKEKAISILNAVKTIVTPFTVSAESVRAKKTDSETTTSELFVADLLKFADSLEKISDRLTSRTDEAALAKALGELSETINRLKITVDNMEKASAALPETMRAFNATAKKLGVAGDQTADLATRFGNTFVGRLLVARPETTARGNKRALEPSPTPQRKRIK